MQGGRCGTTHRRKGVERKWTRMKKSLTSNKSMSNDASVVRAVQGHTKVRT